MTRLCTCDEKVLWQLLRNPCEYCLCYVYINHSRYSRIVSRRAGFDPGESKDGFCVFRGLGCSRVSLDSMRLSPTKVFDSATLLSNDSYLQL